MEASVTNIELYRIWKSQEDLGLDWIVARLTAPEATEKMKAGKAFHAALEKAQETEHYSVSANGYAFSFLCDAEMALPQMRECSVTKNYAGLLVKGRVDGIYGKAVSDIKTTEDVDLDRYMESLQWRYYLDMTDADRFDWHIFQMREVRSNDPTRLYEVFGYHKLTQYRYVNLAYDCLKAAQEYKEFAEIHLRPSPETSLK
jgi:hypothetical protein